MNPEEPLVSIPIFTYNGEKFLRKQLDSILAQTYKNIEIIVCDDGSKDGTVAIINDYAQRYNLKTHFNETNIGVHANVAKGLMLCNGDFIATSDQDDIWKPEKIKSLVDAIGDNVLIYSRSVPINENDEPINGFTVQGENLIKGSNNKAFLFDNCVSGHTMMFKRKLLKHIVPLPPDVYPDWWIAFVASTYGTIDYYEKPLVSYRRHNLQMTKEQKKQKIKFYKKIYHKDHQKKSDVQRKINILTAFSSLNILDKETKSLVDNIIVELYKFPKVYSNKKLFNLLHPFRNEIFAISKNKDSTDAIKHLTRGIWYYRIKFYT